MRGRVTRTFCVAVAAGVTILGAAAPGAAAAVGGAPSAPSGGTPIPTNANCVINVPPCGMAGYQASGRDFRYAQAVITVPAHAVAVTAVPDVECDGCGGSFVDPTLYMALDDSTDTASDYARVGIQSCGVDTPADCPDGDTGGWEAFAQVVVSGGTPVGGSDSVRAGARYSIPGVAHPIPADAEGRGTFVSVYLTPAGNSVHTLIMVPATTTTPGATYNDTFPVNGPVYTTAQALEDWTDVGDRPAPPVPAALIRDTQFGQGGFTTLGGQRGTFTGPWALQAVEATSDGTLPPAGTVIAQPSYLWTDHHSPGGLRGDAFGVWRFPS
jgi:hypothetical protein